MRASLGSHRGPARSNLEAQRVRARALPACRESGWQLAEERR